MLPPGIAPGVRDGSSAEECPTLFGTLRRLYLANRYSMLGTFALTNLENAARVVLPLLLGLAVDGLLRGDGWMLVAYAGAHLVYVAVGVTRRVWDTRVFTRIYAAEAVSVVAQQHERRTETSRIAARTAMAREFVDFFERDVAGVLFACYGVIGALVALAALCRPAGAGCLLLLVPATLINRWYAAHTRRANSALNDTLEQEVATIMKGDLSAVAEQFQTVRRHRIQLSNLDAVNFGLMDLVILALLLASLGAYCLSPNPTAGDAVAVFRYVIMFVTALDIAPFLVQQLARLHDIHDRLYGPISYEFIGK